MPSARTYTAVPWSTQLGGRGLVGVPRPRARSWRWVRGAELVLEAVDRHLELHRADGREHRRLVTEVGVSQHLHHALLVELGDAAAELLEATRVLHPATWKCSGANFREPGNSTGGSR